MQQLPLHALYVFTVASQHRTFEDAADKLFITQSAVSHQIKRLESFLGITLIDRSGHCHSLLPHAEKLAHSLSDTFSEIETACQRAKRDSHRKMLVIATIPSVATCLLVPNLSNYKEQNPQINLRIVYAIHGQEIDYRDVDIAFVYADTKPAAVGLESTLFLSGESVPVCTPEVQKQIGNQPDPVKFSKAGLLHDSDRSGWRSWFKYACADQPPELSGPVFEDFNLLRIAALAGQGIALCPKAIITDDLRSKRLVQVSDVSTRNTYNYYFIEKAVQRSSTQKEIDKFKKWMFTIARELDTKIQL